MTVVAAGVHTPGVGGAIGTGARLVDGQSVEVGPQGDGPTGGAGGELAHHAGASDALVHLHARLPKDGGHVGRGVVFTLGQLRPLV